jgi:type IV pilus assembly protein PilB
MDERKRIGELLLDAGVISSEQLGEALAEQQRVGGRLCYNLIRLGHLRADDLVGFLRDQFGVAAVNLERYQIPESVLKLVPAAFARERRVVPLHIFGGTLTVAMLDPSRAEDVAAVREITGLEPDPVICPEAALEAALARFYPVAALGLVTAGDGVLNLDEEGAARQPAPSATPSSLSSAEAWLRRFVLQAVRWRSREIHLEPSEEGLKSRFRVAGALQDGEIAPPELRVEIVRRALAIAGVAAVASGRLPGEGRFRIHARNRWLRATLSAFPSLFGERVVIKIVDESLLEREFQDLGMSKEVADETQRLLGYRHGVILLNAPPGQGSRTTFYNVLSHLKGKGGRNIMTLEDPVRTPIAGITQSQVGGGSGLDFAAGLQSVLHQDPDVVGLTDVPNRSTIEMVFAAARRCLVVAHCGFRDNQQALQWIRDAGVSPATQAQLLRGMLAQRILPKICGGCRTPLAEPVRLVESNARKAAVASASALLHAMNSTTASFPGSKGRRVEELTFYSGVGCEQCGGTGRAGRVAIFELLSVREELRERLLRGDSSQALVEEAQRLGMWSLREDGIFKAYQGLVDVRDVLEATAVEGSPRG